MNTFTFTHMGDMYDGRLDTFHRYADNNNTVVRLESRPVGSAPDAPWELYATLSVNTDLVLPENRFVFKTYSENHGLYEEMLNNGLIAPTHQSVMCGFAGPQPVVTLVPHEVVA